MTGALVDAQEGPATPGEPRRLQKPFRILDVLTVLQEILTAVPAETLRR